MGVTDDSLSVTHAELKTVFDGHDFDLNCRSQIDLFLLNLFHCVLTFDFVIKSIC